MKRVYMEVYGCAVALGEALALERVLKRDGFEIVRKPEEADVAILITCTVRTDSELRMIKAYERLSKKVRKVVVAGCLPSAQPGLVKTKMRGAVMLPLGTYDKVVEAIRGTSLKREYRDWIEDIEVYDGKLIIPVADGCLNNCTFCITKKARQRLVSMRIEKVLEIVKKHVEKVSEIWLTAPDLAAYGVDRGYTLVDLLDKLLMIVPEGKMIRLGMMSPDTFLKIEDDLLNLLKDVRVYKFLHLPLQSASDKVLKLMRRRYSYEEYREMVKRIRKVLLDPTIATDILVGFPGEEDEDFEMTLKALEELAFERVHLAQYTPRPRTLGALMKQVPDPIKKERSRRAMKVVERVGKEVHKRYVGGTFKVLVNEFDSKHSTYVGRLHNYIPVIVKNAEGRGWYEIEVTQYTFYDLRGNVLSTI